MVCTVQRVGITFCLLALAAIQIPWIVCTEDCHGGSVAIVVEDATHVHVAHKDGHHHDGGPHDHGCGCDEEHENHCGGDHLLVQIPAVAPGAAAHLAPHAKLTMHALALAPSVAAPLTCAREAVASPEAAPPPFPPACTEALLL